MNKIQKHAILLLMILAILFTPRYLVYAFTPSGVYTIESTVKSGMVLDIQSASTVDRANVQIYRRNNTIAQQFKIEKYGQYYRIYNMKSGRLLDVAGGSRSDRTNVWQYHWNGTKAQLWSLIETLAAKTPGFSHGDTAALFF